MINLLLAILVVASAPLMSVTTTTTANVDRVQSVVRVLNSDPAIGEVHVQVIAPIDSQVVEMPSECTPDLSCTFPTPIGASQILTFTFALDSTDWVCNREYAYSVAVRGTTNTGAELPFSHVGNVTRRTCNTRVFLPLAIN